MYKVKIKVEHSMPPDNDSVYPRGHIKPYITYVEIPIDCTCEKEACKRAHEECCKSFSNCSITVENMTEIDRPVAKFEKYNIDKSLKKKAGHREDNFRTEGKPNND